MVSLFVWTAIELLSTSAYKPAQVPYNCGIECDSTSIQVHPAFCTLGEKPSATAGGAVHCGGWRISRCVFHTHSHLFQSRLKTAHLLCMTWSNTLSPRRHLEVLSKVPFCSIICARYTAKMIAAILRRQILPVHFEWRDISPEDNKRSFFFFLSAKTTCDQRTDDRSRLAFLLLDCGLLNILPVWNQTNHGGETHWVRHHQPTRTSANQN